MCPPPVFFPNLTVAAPTCGSSPAPPLRYQLPLPWLQLPWSLFHRHHPFLHQSNCRNTPQSRDIFISTLIFPTSLPLVPPHTAFPSKGSFTLKACQVPSPSSGRSKGVFTLDVCVCVNVNVKRQEWVQTHSVHLCLHFH